MSKQSDIFFMKQALKMAEQAKKQGEVPVGAVLVQNQTIIATGFNQKEQSKQAISHAEILAIERGCQQLNSWRLNNCDLYVTLEPCLMCAGACLQARLRRLVYACKDPKAGAVHSLYQTLQDKRLNHQIQITGGILHEDSKLLLQSFFQTKRLNKIQKT